MLVHRTRAHVEDLADLAVGLAVGDPQHDVGFAAGEAQSITQTNTGIRTARVVYQAQQVLLGRDTGQKLDRGSVGTGALRRQMMPPLPLVAPPDAQLVSQHRRILSLAITCLMQPR